MRKPFQDHHRSGKSVALTIHFRADVLADARPPEIALRNKWRTVLGVVQGFFQLEPLPKSLQHMIGDYTVLLGRLGLVATTLYSRVSRDRACSPTRWSRPVRVTIVAAWPRDKQQQLYNYI